MYPANACPVNHGGISRRRVEQVDMKQIISLLIIGILCAVLICACVAIDKAGEVQDDEKH
jgi:hypothetical protein